MKDRIRRGIRVGVQLDRGKKNIGVARTDKDSVVQIAPLMFAGVANKTAMLAGISAGGLIVGGGQSRFNDKAVGQTEKNEEHDQGEKGF